MHKAPCGMRLGAQEFLPCLHERDTLRKEHHCRAELVGRVLDLRGCTGHGERQLVPEREIIVRFNVVHALARGVRPVFILASAALRMVHAAAEYGAHLLCHAAGCRAVDIAIAAVVKDRALDLIAEIIGEHRKLRHTPRIPFDRTVTFVQRT